MLSRANYQEQDILRLARRRDTSKRAYLLVNPLQAKHVPSRPGEALAMMEALGRALAAEYPDTGLVVGFAETATAIGAVTAGFFPAGLGPLPGGAQPRCPAEAVRRRAAGAAAAYKAADFRGG